jgi:hypothetical protein
MFVLYLLAEDNREIRDLDAPNEDQTRDHVQQRIGVDSDRHCGRWTTDVPAIIYDFKAIGGTMRKQRIDYWWQPAKARARAERGRTYRQRRLVSRFNWEGWTP